MRVCPFYAPAKCVCLAKLDKYGKEDLAKVITCNAAGNVGTSHCQFAYDEGYHKCPEYSEKTKN